MHINISLFQDGKNIFSDPEAEDGLSQEAKWFMGGIMAHVKGMCAVTNPLVNSYKRLTSGCDAPRDIIWTTKNHNTLLRFLLCGERIPGSSCVFPIRLQMRI